MSIKLTDIKPNPNNPRLIKDERFKKLVQSIEEFPKMMALRPMVVNSDNVVIGGNMRLRALKELGYKEVPNEWVRKADELTEDEIRRFIIADNVGFGENDWAILANEWDAEELEHWGLEIPGFEAEQAEAQEDDYEIPQTVQTDIVLGDLFEIGEHRLLCCDCRNTDEIATLMKSQHANLVVTDPPYGVNYVGKTKEKLEINNDSLSAEQTHSLWRDAVLSFLPFITEGAGIYATVPAGPLQLGFMQVLQDCDCLRQCMVWDKGQMVLGHSDYHYQHEPILYGWKPGGKHYFTKDRTKTTVFAVQKPSKNAEHPTMKPVELWAEFISNSSTPGNIVYDCFLGSGTTMVAAHQLNRKCYGMEIDPKYCQIIIERMLKLDPSLTIKRNGIDETEKWISSMESLLTTA